ncbi:MAG TPA: hypothetical protein VGG74_14510 [Kofleriaceae bacterium]|jgi:hypothetical protein
MRSLLVVAFIGAVAAGAGYLARRPTIARGDVIAADLLAKNAQLHSVTCDPQIPIGHDGARFSCVVELAAGGTHRVELELDRSGGIREVGKPATAADPWR